MERDLEKDLIEIECAIKSQLEKDNMFTVSVLQRCHKLVAELKNYRDLDEQGRGNGDARHTKTQVRKQLDLCIDTCLECDGYQTEDHNCQGCPNMNRTIELVQKIRDERMKAV